MTIDLASYWERLTSSFDIPKAQANAAFADIRKRYSEAHRVYHTLTHLQHFFKSLEPLGEQSPEVYFALYYHDIIYKPGSKSNEAKSAKLAKSQLSDWGFNTPFVTRVFDLIMMTEQHNAERSDTEACVFLDADMAILGSEQSIYLKYTAKVRKEYQCYPDFLYNKGRKAFLRQTLGSQRIFLSDYFYLHYEQQARSNIIAEIKLLEG